MQARARREANQCAAPRCAALPTSRQIVWVWNRRPGSLSLPCFCFCHGSCNATIVFSVLPERADASFASDSFFSTGSSSCSAVLRRAKGLTNSDQCVKAAGCSAAPNQNEAAGLEDCYKREHVLTQKKTAENYSVFRQLRSGHLFGQRSTAGAAVVVSWFRDSSLQITSRKASRFSCSGSDRLDAGLDNTRN